MADRYNLRQYTTQDDYEYHRPYVRKSSNDIKMLMSIMKDEEKYFFSQDIYDNNIKGKVVFMDVFKNVYKRFPKKEKEIVKDLKDLMDVIGGNLYHINIYDDSGNTVVELDQLVNKEASERLFSDKKIHRSFIKLLSDCEFVLGKGKVGSIETYSIHYSNQVWFKKSKQRDEYDIIVENW